MNHKPYSLSAKSNSRLDFVSSEYCVGRIAKSSSPLRSWSNLRARMLYSSLNRARRSTASDGEIPGTWQQGHTVGSNSRDADAARRGGHFPI